LSRSRSGRGEWLRAANIENDGLTETTTTVLIRKLESSSEVLLMAKTRTALVPELSEFIRKHHSYDLPETIAVGLTGGSADYLEWVRISTKEPPEGGGRIGDSESPS
jgi:hypothetical protein